MISIFREEFPTALGTFEISILSTDSNAKASDAASVNKDVINVTSRSYQITIFRQLLDLNLGNNSSVLNRVAWCIFFQKSHSNYEKLKIRLELNSHDQEITQGPSSGQYLDAISYNDSKYQIHLGTEDGEVLMERAKARDWLPFRYSKYLNFDTQTRNIHIGSFTEYRERGFLTRVPNLRPGEKAYFHFILAGKHYDEDNVDAWLAVDMSKKQLLRDYTNILPNAHGA